MGTHPIFESDFDCLTDCQNWKKMAKLSRMCLFMASTTGRVVVQLIKHEQK